MTGPGLREVVKNHHELAQPGLEVAVVVRIVWTRLPADGRRHGFL
jgi:hypothetical protein